MKRVAILVGLAVLVALAYVFRPYIGAAISPVTQKLRKPRTVAERLEQFGNAARARLVPHFERAGVAYPPKSLVLLGLKQERLLEVYAGDMTNKSRFIRAYPVLAASGKLGPKLREGDRQVPEGIYGTESLNPNSRFHLSLRIGYPNSFDRAQAEEEGRTNLGGDIMIHGGRVSVGCLAVGDEAAEDLFVLATLTGLDKITVILSPVDFREGRTVPKTTRLPPWTDELYQTIRTQLNQLPRVSR